MYERQYIVLTPFYTLLDALDLLQSNTTEQEYPDTVIYIDETVDMYDILVEEGLFKSKGDAKRNWNKTGKEIPSGFTLFERLGKKKNKSVCIHNFKE